jgi:adenylate cyclase
MSSDTPLSTAPARERAWLGVDDAPEFTAGRLATLLLFGALAGGAYARIYDTSATQMLRGAVTGGLIAGGVSVFELLLFQIEPGKRLQTAPFGLSLAVRAVAWMLAILAGLAGGRIIVPMDDGMRLFNSHGLVDIAFSFAISFVAIGALAVKRLLGGDVVLALLSGRYYRPRTEQRVFLLLDMVGSTALADRFGDRVYLGVLNRLLQAVTPVIAHSGGEIYRYVGDAVIVTWPQRLAPARAATAAVACAAGCVARVRRDAPRFEAAFGTAPALRAAIHLGPVIGAELGTLKREISFVGDTMNTLARIEQAAREGGRAIVFSDDVRAAATLPQATRAEPLGDFTPRGKHASIALYALEAAA